MESEPRQAVKSKESPTEAAAAGGVSAVAEERLALADQAFARGDLRAARDFLKSALELTPKSIVLWTALGNIQYQLEAYSEALIAFQRAVNEDAGNVDLLVRLANAATRCGNREVFNGALARARDLDVRNPMVLRLGANDDFMSGRFASAAEQFCALLKPGIQETDLLLQLGKCLYELGDSISARWCYDRVLALDPANEIARQALACLASACAVMRGGADPIADFLRHTLDFCTQRLDQSDFCAAREALCRAHRLAPSDPQILLHRARLSLFLKEYHDASQDFTAVLRLDPRCAAAQSGLAQCHLRRGATAEARECAQRALAMDQGDEEAASVLASLSERARNRPVRRNRPKVLFLADQPGWAYDTAAQAISRRLADEFDIRVEYSLQRPDLRAWAFDLAYVFFWGETYHRQVITDPRRVVKEISSHRWANEQAYGYLSAQEMAARYLPDAATLTATSKRLQSMFSPFRRVLWTPNGFEENLFSNRGSRSGALRVGWAGNANEPCKGLKDILLPASGNDLELHVAGGELSRAQMAEFYNSIDVLCIASTAEGEPLTLIESMACGCFPVAVDVGIVPELVQHRQNGLIINRNVAAFQAAFQWCKQNLEYVREMGVLNAQAMLQTRTWDRVSGLWRAVLRESLQNLAPSRANGKAVSTFNDSPKPASETPQPAGPPTGADSEARAMWHRNLGDHLLTWPERAQACARVIQSLGLPTGSTVIDLGCGHQTLRALLSRDLHYVPIDRLARTPDVVVMDLNQRCPEGHYQAAVMLGLLEYMDDPGAKLAWASEHADWLLFSYNDCSDPARCAKQHWKSRLTFHELESRLTASKGEIVEKIDLGRSEFLYAVRFRKTIAHATFAVDRREPESAGRTVALFSAAVNGDNSGDSLIVDAIQRLLGGQSTRIFPLLQTLTDEQIEQVNECDLAIICGTNLYQDRFSCSLSPQIIDRLKVPLIPLGLGSSAPIGQLPIMDEEGICAVRMIHERCAVASVRDPASLRFVRSLGIRNVELTGCPVLFHGLHQPAFLPSDTARLIVSVRARLLHLEGNWNSKAFNTLECLCREFNPTLILQSPYDLEIARSLRQKYGVNFKHDDSYGHEMMLRAVQRASRTVGFRLHFGMLALSYGKHAIFIATDTRTSEFCSMMGLPFHDMRQYRDETLVQQLREPVPDMTSFLANWRALSSAMGSVLERNNLIGANAVSAQALSHEFA
ncbi:MAG TPA: polysaccharide pyruvyl transferase family protein [Verrucomicrobiae bacterium]|nr:polysaccharide pyruvyl transferase family protein [Verrucomicrobiae bacterium]